MKYSDLILEDPITGDTYLVQVKSRATQAEFSEYCLNFPKRGYRKLYFVVHTVFGTLAPPDDLDNIELVLPHRLAEMVVDHGLLRWLMRKVQ